MRMFVALIAAMLAMTPAARAEIAFPALTGRVVDTADQIPQAQEADLERDLADFERRTKHQMVVVTVPDLNGVPKEDYAYKLGRHWGIGRKGIDDGIVLLQSPGNGQPGSGKLYIAVGYGLEDVFPDSVASAITRDVMVPILKQDRPRSETTPEAIVAGARAAMKVASVTREELAAATAREQREATMAAAREKAQKEQAHRRFMAGLWDFLLACGGLLAVGSTGYVVWRALTSKERARRRAEEEEIARLEEIERAKLRRAAAEQRAEEQRLAREEAERQAQEERRRIAEEQRKRQEMLDAMSPVDRANFLAEEEERRERRERERRAEEERQREAAERRRREDEEARARRRREEDEARERRRRQDEEDARNAAIIAANSSSWSSSSSSSSSSWGSSDSFSGGGGSFGGGGGGTDY